MRRRWIRVGQNQWSLWSVIVCWTILFFFRFHPVHDKPISWDALGYYLPLAFTCIHHDPLLTDKAWLQEKNEQDDLTGTLYQITVSPEGKDMYFFLFGWSYCYAPFFGIGHLAAIACNYPADGFSWPYQLALMAGGLIYMAIGLIYWRKILLLYFDDGVAAITIFCIVVGTNFVNHLSIDNLSTVNLLFMWMSVLIWNTSAWYRTGLGKHLVGILFSWGIMSLIKPSETLVCLIPLLWKAEWNRPATWLSAFRQAFQTPGAEKWTPADLTGHARIPEPLGDLVQRLLQLGAGDILAKAHVLSERECELAVVGIVYPVGIESVGIRK